MHEGHRQRMLERLANADSGLQDHELLEILLFNAIRRKNTNELAHRLLDSFGSLSGVLHADYEQLLAVDGVGKETAAYLRVVGLIRDRSVMEKQNGEYPSAANYEEFSKLLFDYFQGLSEEIIVLFGLDTKEHVRYQTRFNTGKGDSATVTYKEISQFLTACRPHALIVAHNHPSGSSKPSKSDDVFTGQIQFLCSAHGVHLRDHVIVGNNEMYSYFTNHRLEEIQARYSFNSIFGEKRS